MNAHADNSYDHEQYNKRLMGNVIRLPMEVNAARGERVFDKQAGRWLLDFWGDEGVASLGYASPEFNTALVDFLQEGHPHRLPDVYPNQIRWECAETICDRTGFDRLFYANSGTEANEAAIKLARKYWWDKEPSSRNRLHNQAPGRFVIYTVAGNFHGRTGFALSASDFRVSPYHRFGFGPEAPGFGVIDLINGEWKEVAYDGEEHQSPIEPDWDCCAAIIMAPVLGNNCVKTYSPEFWAALAKARADHGVLVIYDDVQAGNGRAGHFATYQNPGCGVKPDIMTLSKGIAMGLPMSVMLAREEVAKSFTPGVHFNTFGGTILCCYLAKRYYHWLDEHLPELRAKGERIRTEFAAREWLRHYDGWGMLNAFEPNFNAHGYDAFQFIARAREHGLSLCTHRQIGMIRFTPPMNTQWSDIQEALEALDKTHLSLAK